MANLTKENVVSLRNEWLEGVEMYKLVTKYDLSPKYIKRVVMGHAHSNAGGPIAPSVRYNHSLEEQQVMCEHLREGKTKLWIRRNYGVCRRDMTRIASNCKHHIYEKIQSGELEPYIT